MTRPMFSAMERLRLYGWQHCEGCYELLRAADYRTGGDGSWDVSADGRALCSACLGSLPRDRVMRNWSRAAPGQALRRRRPGSH